MQNTAKTQAHKIACTHHLKENYFLFFYLFFVAYYLDPQGGEKGTHTQTTVLQLERKKKSVGGGRGGS